MRGREAKFSVWFKNFAGDWVEWGNKFPSMRSAKWGVKYVQKFALNGQAGVFQIGESISNDLQAVMNQLA